MFVKSEQILKNYVGGHVGGGGNNYEGRKRKECLRLGNWFKCPSDGTTTLSLGICKIFTPEKSCRKNKAVLSNPASPQSLSGTCAVLKIIYQTGYKRLLNKWTLFSSISFIVMCLALNIWGL